MKDLKRIENAISLLNTEFPRPSMPLLSVGHPYCLSRDWPGPWPGAGQPGVYILLDSEGGVLYVGKASCNVRLGDRLGHYFKYGEDRSWRSRYQCYAATRYVITVPLPTGRAFEAPAIEDSSTSMASQAAASLGSPCRDTTKHGSGRNWNAGG